MSFTSKKRRSYLSSIQPPKLDGKPYTYRQLDDEYRKQILKGYTIVLLKSHKFRDNAYDLAQDLTQETLVGVWNWMKNIDDWSGIHNVIASVGNNQFDKFLRQSYRNNCMSSYSDAESDAAAAAVMDYLLTIEDDGDGVDPEKDIIEQEDSDTFDSLNLKAKKLIKKAMKALRVDERSLVRDRYIRNYSRTRMMTKHGYVNEYAYDMRFVRIRRKLKDSLIRVGIVDSDIWSLQGGN